MERKERILEYIKSSSYIPLKFEELAVVLEVPEEARAELSRILKELEAEGRIISTKKGRYMACDNVRVGKLICNRNGNFGFVISEDEEPDIFVDIKRMGNALSGDVVSVRKEETGHGERPEGRIIKVIERNVKEITGVIEKAAYDCFYVIPDDKRIFARVRVRGQSIGAAKDGDRVLVQITRYENDGRLTGMVKKSFGSGDKLQTLVEALIAENNVKTEFDPETVEQAKKIPNTVEDISGRLDLREECIFTIDGETARDFDDAVGVERLENGNVRLGVHIADVSNYVTEGSPLDREAFERGTSVYLPDRVIPMLPERLSNGICSLNPNEDRLTVSVIAEIDSNGDVVSHSIQKSVIRSKMRMTYERVNAILERGEEPGEYAPFTEKLELMRELAEVLYNKRVKRGAIEFDFPETKILTDEEGNPISVDVEERGISNHMIEEFMLLANETVAEFAFWSEIPFIYRVHEAPSPEKLAAFNLFLKPFGLGIKGKIDKDNPIKPKALEQIMDKVRDTPEERIVAKNMLRSLMKAEYSPDNAGHFGLAAKYYCHFTSPIRRYPDLAVHRALKWFLEAENEELTRLSGFVKKAARDSSENEQKAENVERDADDLMKAAFMSQFIGEEFSGIVSGVTSFGIFAELENGTEGIIRLENLTDDYYEYDEITMTLSGKATGRSYKIGDSIDVTLVKCNLFARRIELVRTEDVSYELMRKFRESDRNRELRRKSGKRMKKTRKKRR